jgi:hypothetical protein
MLKIRGKKTRSLLSTYTSLPFESCVHSTSFSCISILRSGSSLLTVMLSVLFWRSRSSRIGEILNTPAMQVAGTSVQTAAAATMSPRMFRTGAVYAILISIPLSSRTPTLGVAGTACDQRR